MSNNSCCKIVDSAIASKKMAIILTIGLVEINMQQVMLCICKIRFIVLSYTHASKCNIKSGCWITICDKISFDAQNIKFLIKVQILRLLNIAILNIFQISKRITVQEMLSANWKIKKCRLISYESFDGTF